MLTFDSILGIALTGLLSFSGVYFGVALGERRNRYHQHVNRLKDETVDVVERWSNDIAVNFSTTRIPFLTLEEEETRQLRGFERQGYWDVPAIFAEPWDARDERRLRMAASHWPELVESGRISQLGEATYFNIGILHQKLVHLDDDVDYPPQPESLGLRDNLNSVSCGARARIIMRDAFTDFTKAKSDDLVTVVKDGEQFGVICVCHLIGVFDDYDAAITARNTITKNLSGATEAARSALEHGNSIKQLAARLQERSLDLMSQAATAGICPDCREVAPIRHRFTSSYRTFCSTRKKYGWLYAWKTARHLFQNGVLRPEPESTEGAR